MARIAGVNIPDNKRTIIGLTYIFGIGGELSKKICQATSISPDKRVKELSDKDLITLREYIDSNFMVEGEHRRKVSFDF